MVASNKLRLYIIILFASLSAILIPSFANTEESPFSLAITRYEMKRCPGGLGIDYQYSKKWQYSVFTELEAMLNANDYNMQGNNSEIVSYVIGYLDQLVESDGTIYKYKITDYNLDNVKGGTLLLYAYDLTGDEKYLTAAHTLWSQLKGQPTTSDGGYWHKNIYPYQMWLDGLFMAEPFAARYARRFLSGQELEDAFTHIVKQFTLVTTHTYDAVTGLYRHGWDEKKVQFWADKATGQSAHAWGRAMGWTFMAIPYVMEQMPADHPKRSELEDLFRKMASSVISAQDPATGLWWQVLDCPGKKGNYLEATASTMFVYTMLRGYRMKILDDKCLESALKGWEGLNNLLITERPDGSITLSQCCSVGGLGGSYNRDGSFEYYISEAVRDNDGKGMGPLINAAIEIERLEKEQSTSITSLKSDSGEIAGTIYNLQGHLIPSSDVQSLSHGIYIVVSPGGKVHKIVVR